MSLPSTKRFAIRRRLGEGGMGAVYEAHDQERQTRVALKMLTRVDGEGLARFKREFRAMQGLSHPGLVSLGELFFEEDAWFFTMELLDGVDFLTWIRGPRAESDTSPPTVDAARARDAIRQLLEALAALHGADKVHRDIKPSNVMVLRNGRVVVLDFGLVAEASHDRSTGMAVVGTPAYMAPEQAASREVGPAADLYSVGVMLYEALTGDVPIKGSAIQILLDKQTREAPAASSVVAGVPEDLSTLCAKLLRFDPAKRPTIAEILPWLAAAPTQGRASLAPRTSSDAPAFVGRAPQLAALRAAYDDREHAPPSVVLVSGESGIGKSFLVRRFTGQLVADRADTILLEGRCYEREAVPFKTLDGVVDALSRRLSRMPDAVVGQLLPVRAGVLGQLFPVMLRVPQIAREHAARASMLAPHEIRQRGFLALRELLTRAAIHSPLVIAIDDLQWADDDGLRGLTEILRGPDPPPLLLIGTVREVPNDPGAGLRRLRAALPGEPREIALSNLGHEEAREMAARLLERASAVGADPELIAREAGGHPLFVEELSRHVALGGSARDEKLKLDAAIWSRVTQLDPRTRALAEVVAAAGKPLPQEVIASAAHLEPVEFSRHAASLRVANLVRTAGARWADAIEPYHDRVRESVLAQLTPARRRAIHEAIAIAIESSSYDDPEALATHWREAGSEPRAAACAETAGDRALQTFAFDRAAEWYEQALGLFPADHPNRRALRVKLGDALASAGRGALAATHFEAAAAESPPVLALELRRRVADQLLRSGHFDRGVEASRAVLAAIGMRMPQTRLGTMLAIVYYRLILKLRGLGFRERERGQITAEELTRIDACWSVGSALGYADTFVGFVFTTRALLLALATGDLDRIARTLGGETSIVSTAGRKSWKRTARLIQITEGLAARSGTVQARAWASQGAGIAYYCNGRFREAAEHLGRTLDMLQDGSAGLVFERVTARMYLIFTHAYSGRFKELRRLQEEGLADALARGDVYAAVTMRLGNSNLAWLAADRADLAESHVRAATQEWSKSGFHLEHAYAHIAGVHLALYTGDAERAHALANDYVVKCRRSLLWRIQPTRLRALQLRAMAALACVERGAGDRAALLTGAARDAGAIEREGVPWMTSLAALVRAGIARHAGSRDDALARLDAAARDLDGLYMSGYAAAARHHAACLRSDEAGVAAAIAHFRAEDVANPQRMIAMLAPGLAP